MLFNAIHELGKGHPIPAHRRLHNGHGDSLSPFHPQHRPLAILRTDGGKAKATVPDRHTRYPVPARQRGIRIPAGKRRIVVGVNVHEPGSHDQPSGIDDALSAALNIAHSGDLAIPDTDVATERRHPQAIDDRAVFNKQIIISHTILLLAHVSRLMVKPKN